MSLHSHSHPHSESHFRGSLAIRDWVVGMSDGLTVPFALAAGLSAAVHDNRIIVTAGIAEIVAGSIAMALGGYLAGRTEIEHYDGELKREAFEIEHLPDREKQEVRDILHEYSLSPETTEKVVDELFKNKDAFLRFMMRFELGLERPGARQASISAFRIGVAYLVGGTVPLVAYVVLNTPQEALGWSFGSTVVSLFAFGYIKGRLTGQPAFISAVKVSGIGILAAAAAFSVALLFR